MTQTDNSLRDRIAHAIYDRLEGEVNNQDWRRQQDQWEQSQKAADDILVLVEQEADSLGSELGTVMGHNDQLLAAIEPFAKATLHSASTAMGFRDGSYFYASDGCQNVHCAIKADDVAKVFNRAREAFERFALK